MIDWERIAELQEEIGEDDFAEIGQVFVEEIEEKLSELAASPERTPADFHFLRGSAANLGLISFAEACKDAETRSKSGEVIALAPLKALFDAALSELEDLFETA